MGLPAVNWNKASKMGMLTWKIGVPKVERLSHRVVVFVFKYKATSGC
jgi:hypothetical protein